MDPNKLFINKRYVTIPTYNFTTYINRNGILKKGINSPLLKKITKEEDIWFSLDELPQELQEKLKDMAITLEEFSALSKKNSKIFIIDQDNVTIYIDKDTPVLPIVGNFLPNDGVNAYTVINENGKPKLKAILICWDCHWSDLFTGQTKYGMNVFCLASDLTDEQRETFLDEIITLSDVEAYLEQHKEKIPRI